MTDLVAFLLARLDEDEQAARAAYDEAGDYRVVGSELAELHFVLHKPDRVLAQVAALRAVVEQCARDAEDYYASATAMPVLHSLAGIWRDHEDFDPAWKGET